MLKILSAATLLVVAGASLAQSTQPGQTTPSITPSQTPAITPSQTPVVGPTAPAPVIEPRALGGLSRCENLLAFERDKCLQEERAAAVTGGTAPGAPAGSAAPTGPTAPSPAAPMGSGR
jgi:hypothetical protein